MLSYIDNLLNRITMYKLLLYYLIALILIGIGYSFAGILHFSAAALIVSTLILVIVCWVVNKFFAEVMHAPMNVESVYITALILALIIAPYTSFQAINITFLLAAAGLAIASKYVLTINKQHIFNPAAIAVALTALGPHQSASWWVGTTALLPFVLIGGILIVRKIHRGRMVVTFFLTSLLATVLYSLLAKTSVTSSLHITLFSSAMFFLGFVMLTEPLTTPPTVKKQTWYAALVGVLFPPQFHIFNFYSTPELALIVGNVFSYLVSPKTKLFPTLSQKLKITRDSIDFIFQPETKLSYLPGQYMEWTLPHTGTDSRGNRRYFTLASSPTEPDLRLGVKFNSPGSSYKNALLKLEPETPIVAGRVSGDFVLPKDTNKKLVLIAGGIGVTPYRSMVKYLLDREEMRDIIILYSAKTTADLAYRDIFAQARHELGLKVIYTLTDKTDTNTGPHYRHGRVDVKLIKQEVPDYSERTYYISGTQSMVKSVRKLLSGLGIPKKQIIVDYFSGYN